MHGIRRVSAFCVLVIILPSTLIVLPLYLRHSVFADVTYAVAESDVITIRDGLSSIFCQRHSLRMNSSFNAFQLRGSPEISHNRKHIRLKKSMSLPDDTLEYWGFFLLRGATVELKVCSRFEGSRILVVRGQKNLRTCGLLEHNTNKTGMPTNLATGQGKLTVTFETAAELVESTGYEAVTKQDNNNSKKVDENQGGEVDIDTEDVTVLENIARNYIDKHTKQAPITSSTNIDNINHIHIQNKSEIKEHKFRHSRNHERVDKLARDLLVDQRSKREISVLDRAFNHGGNAEFRSGSVSSFEDSLLSCYSGDILLSQGFLPSALCLNVQFLDQGFHMITKHEVAESGYFYYIFYSDNDFVRNDIHAIFDIYKPTYQYANISEMECVNSTSCSFPIDFWSDKLVIVEVPTRDGIEHEEDDITLLISTCHPRVIVYAIFPISVMFLILGCAFL